MRKRKDILPTNTTSFRSKSSSPKTNPFLPNKLIIIIESALILFLIILVFYYRNSLTKSKADLITTLNAYSAQQIKEENQANELIKLREELIASNNNNNDDGNDDGNIINNDNEPNPNVDKAWIKKIEQNDYRSLRLQYGDKEPIKVLIETNFGEIIIELAPISSMPHVVRYFTTLIENGYWNGCHFFRNAGHVIQANCHHRVSRPKVNDVDMIKLGQESSIIFQEYDDSLSYLHQKFSIGLAGRPGGPDFYVNLVDNKRNHGPGGQGPEPDPCFGNIVSGFDVIDKIHELEHDGSAMRVLKEWVEFNKVSIIKQNE